MCTVASAQRRERSNMLVGETREIILAVGFEVIAVGYLGQHSSMSLLLYRISLRDTFGKFRDSPTIVYKV